ncbi:MAG: hypothetical protein ACREUD_01245 [Gammaproteobacteria bacterium]
MTRRIPIVAGLGAASALPPRLPCAYGDAGCRNLFCDYWSKAPLAGIISAIMTAMMFM